jgi:long-chain acyl-CoA synthetase
MGREHGGTIVKATVSGPELPPLPETATLVEPLLQRVAEHPDDTMFSVRAATGFRAITVREVADRVLAVARGLVAAGVAPGDRVALMSRTRMEWMLFDLAILRAGGVTVPIYDTSSSEQIEWIVGNSGAVLAIVETAAMAAAADQAIAAESHCREILVIDSGAEAELGRRGATVDPAEVERRSAALRADDVATVIYTSGTTGRPKGCPLTHRNLRVNSLQSAIAVAPALQADEVGMMFLPLAHVLTKAYAQFCVERGMPIAFATDVAHLAEEFPLAQPTVIAAVPRIFEKVYEGARRKAHDEGKGKIFEHAAKVAIDWSQARAAGKVPLLLGVQHSVLDRLVYGKIRAAFGGRLRFAFSGGGPLGERLTHFFAGIGLDVYEGYGLTETSPLLTINRPGAWKPGTVGRAVAGTHLAITDDGEILARGPQVFAGYWHNEAASAEVFTDGWFRTGDIGELDADGYLRITGRMKELIVTAAGKNVAPAPLEDRLRASVLVSQALVVGEGRPFVAALLALDEDALTRWCVEHGRPAVPAAELARDPELLAHLQTVVDEANASVSKAESIRRFAVLPRDLTIDHDELTATLKVRRAVVEREYHDLIESMYSAGE